MLNKLLLYSDRTTKMIKATKNKKNKKLLNVQVIFSRRDVWSVTWETS